MLKFSEHVLEIRYKPNPKVLDYRGSWAEVISQYMELPQWRIVENRIDIYDEKTKEHAFVGFRNAGFQTIDVPTKNYFADKSVKFMKHLFTLTGFEKALFINRIGVRSRFCEECKHEFQELLGLYTEKYLTLTKNAKDIIDAKLTDICGPLNFSDDLGNFNTISGPMNKEEIEKYFNREEEAPDVGLYFDIDYWLKPEKIMDEKALVGYISKFALSAWHRYEALIGLVLEVGNNG